MNPADVFTKKWSNLDWRAACLLSPVPITIQACYWPSLKCPDGQAIDVAQHILIQTVEADLSTNPISMEELERARQQILKQREMAANSTDNIAVSLSDWAAQGDWRLYFRFRDIVESLTVEEVQQAANRYLVRNNRTVGLYIPSEKSERVVIPESPNLSDLFKNYQGRASIAAGEAFDPTPINIENRTQRGILVDGIQFALLPKRTRGESVSLMLTLRYGNAEALQGRAAATDFLPALMSRGTVRLSYTQLQDELTRLRAELQVSGQPGLLQFYVKTKRDKLPEVLDLIHDIVRLPRWEPSELEVIRRQSVTGIEHALKDPQALAGLNTRRALAPYSSDDVRYLPTMSEELDRVKRVTIEQIISLHRDFLSSQAGELAVVGDFDPSMVSERMTRMLAGWNCLHNYVRIARPAVIPSAGSLHLIETPDKANAVFYASQHLQIADGHPDFVKLVLGNYILGGGALSSRLGIRVRQQDGLSYSVGSVLNGSAQDERTEMSYYAIANPESKDRLLSVIREVITNYRDRGMTAEELTRAKEGYLQQQSVARTEDRRLASLLVATLFNNRNHAILCRPRNGHCRSNPR
jgi:zinc protease